MAVNYIIDFSDPGVPSFVIGPGQTNNDLSISLFGQGATNYGEGINENLLHMLENFAHTTAPTNPTLGQLWYDKDQAIFKVFDGTDFVSSGSVFVDTTAPAAPNPVGQLWFDTSVPQLKVNLVAEPPGSASFVSVADRYILTSGNVADPMTGFLFLSADPTLDLHAATKNYVDENSLIVFGDNRTVTDFVKIDTAAGHGGGSGAGVDFSLEIDARDNTDGGGLLIRTGDINDDQFGIRILNVGASELFSVLADSGDAAFSGFVTSAATPPTDVDHLTRKDYVDGEIAGVTGSFAEINPSTPQDGDIRISTGPTVIEIRADGVWNQVFPAQYS